MNDPVEHATGLEKRELLAMKAGNENPFDMKVFKRGPGTKEQPNLIPSAFDARLVGCVCELFRCARVLEMSLNRNFPFSGEEEQTFVQWMWLYQGEPKRCECGHWYKLVEKAPI